MTNKNTRYSPPQQPYADLTVQIASSSEQDASESESTRKTAALGVVTAVVGIATLITMLVNGQLMFKRTILLGMEQKTTTKSTAWNTSLSRVNCSGYWELRDVDVRQPALAQTLCCGRYEAFKMVSGRYPICELNDRPPSQLMRRVAKAAVKLHMTSDITGRDIAVYAYADGDPISQSLRQNDSRKLIRQSVTTLYNIAKLFPADLTFMDIGCQVGFHSLQARDARLHTVAVDANLRNLLRLRMAANDMGWLDDGLLKLLWLHFDRSAVSLKFLNFEAYRCNAAGAGFSQAVGNGGGLNDTIPVMSGGADDLLGSVETQLVVMRIGIEAEQLAAFLATGTRLFEEKDVVAVHLTSWDLQQSESDARRGVATDFFEPRNYALLAVNDLCQELDPWVEYQDTETVWIRKDFLRVVKETQTASGKD